MPWFQKYSATAWLIPGVNESIAFSYDHALITAVYDGMPTPLVPSTITGVYNSQAAVGSPSVTPSSASSIREGQDLEVSVESDSTNLNIESVISGFITVDEGKRYSLTYDENFVLRGIIPYSDVKEKGSFSYKVTLFDGTNTAVSGCKDVTVLQGGDQVDQTKAPALVITEILPDSTNVSGVSADAYEFLEVYNNSDQDINLRIISCTTIIRIPEVTAYGGKRMRIRFYSRERFWCSW